MERQDSFSKYAIFQIGKHQYQGIEGKTVSIQKIDGEAGQSVEFKEVLLKKDNETVGPAGGGRRDGALDPGGKHHRQRLGHLGHPRAEVG